MKKLSLVMALLANLALGATSDISDKEFCNLVANGSEAEIRAALADGANAKAKIVKEIRQHTSPKDFKIVPNNNFTALMVAAEKNPNPEVIKALIEAGAELDAVDSYFGETALLKALQEKNYPAAKELIKAGANVNLASKPNKQTALMTASNRGDIETIKMLLNAGAEVNVRNDFESSPLGLAASFASAEVVNLLVKEGKADINEQDSTGFTPLMAAITWDNVDTVAELLSLGVDTQIKDKDGKTALEIAKTRLNALEEKDRHNIKHIIALLEEKEPKPEAKAKINLDPYKNERYGFSFSLAPSNWVATESDNGDGITVKDDNTEVRVYGTRAYAVLGQNLKEAMDELSKDLTSFSRMELDDSKGLFTIEGKNKEGGLIYIRCFFKEDYAIVAHILSANGNEESFNRVAAVIEATFH